MTLCMRQQKTHRYKEQALDSVGEGGEGGEIWENDQSKFDAWNGTQSWYTGTIQRDGMGREVGGGFGMGDSCTPVADSHQCMAKTTTIL